MELLISYGIISTTLIILGILIILIRSFKIINLNKIQNKDIEIISNRTFNKAWWSATATLFFSQLFDIQFLDFRISMIFWVLLSGLSTMKVYERNNLIS